MYISKDIVTELIQKSRESDRKRSHLLLHATTKDQIQSLLFGLQPSTRIRVHRHFNPTETICCLKGRLAVFFYDDRTNIIEVKVLDNRSMILKFDPSQWHSYICIERDTVGWELKEGPYFSEQMEFAKWCPDESEIEFISFQNMLLDYLGG